MTRNSEDGGRQQTFLGLSTENKSLSVSHKTSQGPSLERTWLSGGWEEKYHRYPDSDFNISNDPSSYIDFSPSLLLAALDPWSDLNSQKYED
jgi:hypothetical protein